MRPRSAFLVVSLFVAGFSSGSAQTPPSVSQTPRQTPVFKGRLDVVRVDVTVIENKSGKPVRGLTERDFTISENGTRQTIASFADESLGDPSASPDDPSNRRVFLFIVTAGDFDPYKRHDGVAEFIRERLRPQDLVGVMSLGRLSQMTTDHERIATIVDRLKRTIPFKYRELQRPKNNQWGQTREWETFADDWMEPGSSATDFFKNPVPFLFGRSHYQENADDTTLSWNARLAIQDSLKVVAGIEYLRRIPGDKHIVLLTPLGFDPPFSFRNEGVGLFLRDADDDKRFAAYANDAGVAVDVILLSGTGPFAVKSRMSTANVAEDSGGQFSSLRIASQQLARIDEGTRNGYIIGYAPSKPEMDGKYRNVKVTVNRNDVTVVYRHGYTATTQPENIDVREVFTRQRLRDAAAGADDLNDIDLKLQAVSVPGPKPYVRVALDKDITKLPLAERGGKWEGDLDVVILCGDKKQEVVCRLDQRMTLSMSKGKYEQARVTGVPYSTTIPVTGQAALVKVIVYHFDSDRIGVFTMNLK